MVLCWAFHTVIGLLLCSLLKPQFYQNILLLLLLKGRKEEGRQAPLLYNLLWTRKHPQKMVSPGEEILLRQRSVTFGKEKKEKKKKLVKWLLSKVFHCWERWPLHKTELHDREIREKKGCGILFSSVRKPTTTRMQCSVLKDIVLWSRQFWTHTFLTSYLKIYYGMSDFLFVNSYLESTRDSGKRLWLISGLQHLC